MLYTRIKITRPDGSDITDGAPVGLINYPGACIFSQVDVSLGDRLITQSSSTYPYRCLIEALINFGKDTLESVFSAGLFYRDKAGHMDATDPAGENTGLMRRAAFTNASNVVELLAPIHSDIFFQEKLMLNGVDIKIRMTRGKDEFCLMRDDAIAYKLNVVSASLFVKKVTVSPGVRLGHAQALLSTTAKYPIERVCLKNFSIPVGSRVSNQENLFLGTLPKSIILAMTENASFSGAYNKNTFAFKHFNLEFMALYRDGIQIPKIWRIKHVFNGVTKLFTHPFFNGGVIFGGICWLCAGVFLLRASTVRLTCGLLIVENGIFKTAKASRNSFHPRGLYSSRIVCGAVILFNQIQYVRTADYVAFKHKLSRSCP